MIRLIPAILALAILAGCVRAPPKYRGFGLDATPTRLILLPLEPPPKGH